MKHSLVGYWPLDEDSGSTAYDYSGRGNHGTSWGHVFEDVEDNDTTIADSDWNGWTDDSGDLTATSNTALRGSYSLQFHRPSGTAGEEFYARRAQPTGNHFKYTIEIDSQPATAQDGHNVGLYDGGVAGTRLCRMYWGQDGVLRVYDGSSLTSVTSWSSGREYRPAFSLDLENGTYEVRLDEAVYGPFDLDNNPGQWDTVRHHGDNQDGGSAYNVYLDDHMTAERSSGAGPLGTTAYVFDGVDDEIDTDLTIPSPQFTLSVWFNTTSPGDNAKMLYGWDGSWPERTWLDVNAAGNGRVRFWVQDANASGSVTESRDRTDGGWHHAVGTFDGSTVTLYVDGRKIGDDAGPADAGSHDVGMGGGTSFAAYQGSLSMARVYDRALTPNEVAYLYGVSQRGRFASSKKTL